jgi:hypothetical protein
MQIFYSDGIEKFPLAITITNINFSAGTTSNNLANVVFSNSNNVSFGLNGSTITASIPAAGGITFSAGTKSNVLASIVFSNSNNVSFGLNGSTITGSFAFNISGGTTSNNFSNLVFSNSNGVSFGLNGSTLTASIATSLSNVNISAGTTSNNLSNFVFSNSNGISFGLNASTVTASVATSLTNINISAGTTSNNLSALVFSNSNGVTFGLNGSTVTASVGAGGGGGIGAGVSTGGNTAGSTGTITTGNLILVGSNGITLSQSTGAAGSNATVTIAGYPIASYWERFYQVNSISVVGATSQNSYFAGPFYLPYHISGSYIRMLGSLSAASTTFATTANTTFSAGMSNTFFYNIASMGTGASSQSLMSIFSSSVEFIHSINVQANANGSQFSVTHGITYPIEGVTSTFSTSQALSTASFQISTQSLSNFTGFRFLDIAFANSLLPGAYWFLHGTSSTTATQGTNALTGCRILLSFVAQKITSNPVGKLGIDFNTSIQPDLGLGMVTSNAIPGNWAISNVSSVNSPNAANFAIVRQA